MFGVAVVPPVLLAAGVQGAIASLPPRFRVTTLLAASGAGATEAVLAYGRALRDAAGVVRLPRERDAMRNLISYWSDNGAYYFDGYWPLFFNATTNTAQDVFNALKAYHAELGLTIGTVQLDPYWYGGSCGAGTPAPGCAARGWPWAADWQPAPGFFPDGLASLGLPLTLYSNSFAAPPANKFPGNWSWLVCDDCQDGPPNAHVAPEQAYDFFSSLLDRGADMNQNAFEMDVRRRRLHRLRRLSHRRARVRSVHARHGRGGG